MKQKQNRRKFDNGTAKNLKMNDDTYALRRKVIDIIYSVKRMFDADLPRVDVRITESTREYAGLAQLNDNIIWLTKDVVRGYSKLSLRHVVLHEVIHACYGVGHVESCPLMNSRPLTAITDAQANHAFMGWMKKNKRLELVPC